MVYILNREVKDSRTVGRTLQKIYGIGAHSARHLCKKVGLRYDAPIDYLTHKCVREISKEIVDNFKVLTDLERMVYSDMRAQISLKSYKGMRYVKGLPVRGQRTKNNRRTAKIQLYKFMNK